MVLRCGLGILIAIALVLELLAAPAAAELIPVHSRLRLTYDTVDMPTPDDDMGLVGFHYLVDFRPGWYAGIGGFGSVSGDRGGFLTGGLTGGYQKKLMEDLRLDVGLFIGGGGGGAPQGDGLMLRPYAGLVFDLDPVRLGVGYSRVDFPETDIKSDNVAVSIDFPFTSYLSSGRNGPADSALDGFGAGMENSNAGFVRQEFLLKLRSYHPGSNVVDTMALPDDQRIDLVGVQFRHFLNDGAYALVEAMGSYQGDADGYAEIQFGAGYQIPLTSDARLKLNLSLALGAGGGGMVAGGGGGIARAEAGFEYRLSPSCFVAAGGGYFDSFDGSMQGVIVGGEIGHSMDNFGAGFGTRSGGPNDVLIWNRWRLRAAQLTYVGPERKVSADDGKEMQLVGAKIDRLLDDRFYLTGQAASAYAGDAGGYAVGLVGLGFQSAEIDGRPLRMFAEMLVGAAGGGGIAVGEGAIWQPMAGIDYAFNDAHSIQLAGGIVRAMDGDLETPVFDLTFTWRFASLGRKLQ